MKSANTEAIAKELREIDLIADSSDDLPIDDNLNPDFEAQTASDIAELKRNVKSLSDMNKVMTWLLLAVMTMLTITQIN